MPRWLQVALTLVLYAAAMALVWWALKTWVPTFDEWLNAYIGRTANFILTFAVIAAAGIYGFWPRNPDGSARPLLPRRDRR